MPNAKILFPLFCALLCPLFGTAFAQPAAQTSIPQPVQNAQPPVQNLLPTPKDPQAEPQPQTNPDDNEAEEDKSENSPDTPEPSTGTDPSDGQAQNFDIALGETDTRWPVGYLTAQGLVANAYQLLLGYVTPGDRDSALFLALTANEEKHDRLPRLFPQSSQSHPFKATEAQLEELNTTLAPKLAECGNLLLRCEKKTQDAVSILNASISEQERNEKDLEAAKSCYERYNQTCKARLDVEALISVSKHRQACIYYLFSARMDASRRLSFLRRCGQKPEPTQWVSPIRDCYTLNHLCQVKYPDYGQYRSPACKALEIGHCLTLRTAQTPSHGLDTGRPFWESVSAPLNTMKTVQTSWPSCAVENNSLIVTPGANAAYYLGRVSKAGKLSAYDTNDTLKDIAQLTPEGKAIPLEGGMASPVARQILSHFQEVRMISSDGSVWRCGTHNPENQPSAIEAFLTPKGELFEAADPHDLVAKNHRVFVFEPPEMRGMQTHTPAPEPQTAP